MYAKPVSIVKTIMEFGLGFIFVAFWVLHAKRSPSKPFGPVGPITPSIP